MRLQFVKMTVDAGSMGIRQFGVIRRGSWPELESSDDILPSELKRSRVLHVEKGAFI